MHLGKDVKVSQLHTHPSINHINHNGKFSTYCGTSTQTNVLCGNPWISIAGAYLPIIKSKMGLFDLLPFSCCRHKYQCKLAMEEQFKGSVLRVLRWVLLYINRKFSSRPIITSHKIVTLLKGQFTICKKTG